MIIKRKQYYDIPKGLCTELNESKYTSLEINCDVYDRLKNKHPHREETKAFIEELQKIDSLLDESFGWGIIESEEDELFLYQLDIYFEYMDKRRRDYIDNLKKAIAKREAENKEDKNDI